MTIDVREEIAVAPLRRYHVFLAALIALVVFFDGYDNFNPSYVIVLTLPCESVMRVRRSFGSYS